MRKLMICVTFSLALLLMLSGCKNKSEGSKPTPTPSEQSSPKPSDSKKPEKSEKPNKSKESKESKSSDEKSAAAMLTKITGKAEEELGDEEKIPMSFDSEIKAEASTGIGLKTEQFEEYVEEGQISTAALTTSAHEIAVLKCKDENAALAVKALIAANYDSGKRVGVTPEKSAVVNFENYVLLVSSSEKIVETVLDTVKSEADDKAGEPNEFFPKE